MFEFHINNNLVRIGSNASENWDLIDTIKKNDVWVHLKNNPSCHAVIRMSKKNRETDIVFQNILSYTGRMVCLQSSKRISNNIKNVELIYIKGKYVNKGNKVGEAKLSKTAEIFVVENPNYTV